MLHVTAPVLDFGYNGEIDPYNDCQCDAYVDALQLLANELFE